MDIRDFFELHNSVAVSFSGGVDSAVLLMLAKQYADRVKAYCVCSAFQPHFEREDALKISEILKVETEIIPVDILSDSEIVKNPSDRCYLCKKKIFEEIKKAALHDGFETVVEGTNASDNTDDRPGYRALKELNVLSPLRECSYTKKDIRAIAKENRLPVADKPSYACLATRIPTGKAITKELLEKTENAEDLLRKMGFVNFRVRYLDGNAKLEFGKNDFELLNKNRHEVFSLLNQYYDNVYLDLKERADE